ncbi:MAG: FAD-dependent monooxygenase [Marinosulfonomonas sp.]|nr:FAD-dependent monooxygenase [Marinosulfonomonas sp.]
MLIGQQVTIVGAGIGGLASALALAQRGATVRVLEQAKELSEVGAGLQISPNGVAVLDALGLGEKLRAVGVSMSDIRLLDYRHGAPVLRMNLAKYSAGRAYLALHRADLLEILEQGARDAGVVIETGMTVTKVSGGRAGIALDVDGHGAQTAPLVIGADGLHSHLRAHLNPGGAPFFTGQVAWRALVAGPGEQSDDRSVRLYMGPGKHLVIYPLRGGALTNIVAVQEREDWAEESWSAKGNPAVLQTVFKDFCPEVRDLLARVEKVNLWGLFRHTVAPNWTGPGCALIGDAAHPTLPFLAQGANLALEDAWVLADCLATMEQDAALKAYPIRRKARAAKVIAAANANARNYHLRNPVLRLGAHMILRAASNLAPRRVLQQFDWIYGHDVTGS